MVNTLAYVPATKVVESNSNALFDIIMSIVVIFGMSILLAIAKMIVNYLQTTTKNKRVQLILSFAEQAIVAAELTNQPGTAKKQLATQKLDQRLSENGIDKFFTASQIDQTIEYALVKMKEFDFERNINKGDN